MLVQQLQHVVDDVLGREELHTLRVCRPVILRALVGISTYGEMVASSRISMQSAFRRWSPMAQTLSYIERGCA